MDVLQDKARVEASSRAILVNNVSSSNYSQQVPSQIIGLHLSAYFGLDKAVVKLLNSGHQTNCKDSNGQTPLWWSAKKDDEDVRKVLC
jgi:ankyrin repeat protein